MPVAASSWIWPVVLAPFIGSFLGVIAMRLENLRSIAFGRSACPECGTQLAARDLVPLLSWLASHGQCRHCRRPVSLFYPGIELAAIGIAIWSVTVSSGWILWVTCLFGWVLLTLAVIDFKYYVLPDFLTLPLIPAGILVAWVLDPSAVLDHVIGAAGGLFFVLGLRWFYQALRGREGIGLGDAKLLAAAGAWASWSGLPSIVLIAAVVGLCAALLRRWHDGKLTMTDRMPFGAFLCFGIWIVWLYGPLQVTAP